MLGYGPRLTVSDDGKAKILPSADPSRADEQACSFGAVLHDTLGRRPTFDG
jgi:hypothetical protein